MISHGFYRDTGVVLSAIPLGEADRIITLFTLNHGRIRVVAKGARKTKSRFGGRLNQFSVLDLQLYAGKTFDGISQTELIERFPVLSTDFVRFQAASSMAESIQRLTIERDRSVRLFMLVRAGLQALQAGVAPRRSALAVLARASSIQGAHPVLSNCAECGDEKPKAISFRAGGAVCELHSESDDSRYDPDIIGQWRMLLDPSIDFAGLSGLEPSRELESLVVGFATWHFESQFRSFRRIAETS